MILLWPFLLQLLCVGGSSFFAQIICTKFEISSKICLECNRNHFATRADQFYQTHNCTCSKNFVMPNEKQIHFNQLDWHISYSMFISPIKAFMWMSWCWFRGKLWASFVSCVCMFALRHLSPSQCECSHSSRRGFPSCPAGQMTIGWSLSQKGKHCIC